MSNIYVKSDNIVTRKIAGETILVPIRQKAGDLENIYVFNEIGSRIWELIDGRRGLVELGEVLINEFEAGPEEIEKDLVNFLSALEKAGLVKVR